MITDRRGFLASLLALPVVAKLLPMSLRPPTFDGKVMRLYPGQSMTHPSGLRVALVRVGAPWPPPDGVAWVCPVAAGSNYTLRLHWPFGTTGLVCIEKVEIAPNAWAEITFA